MLGNLLTTSCLFSLNMVLLVLAGLLRLLPSFFKGLRRGVRAALTLSIRFYKLIMQRAAPWVAQLLGVDIFNGFARIITTSLLSLALGGLFFWLVHLPINGLTLGLCLLHGFLAGLVWEGEPGVDNLHLGERIE